MKLVKTQFVADTLDVAPKTVQNWVRKYHISIITNDRGHYLYDDAAIEQLQAVKQKQLPDREPIVQKKKEVVKEGSLKTSTAEAEKRMEEILRRLEHLEKMIEKKADEVVSFQLLKHRHELDDVQKSVLSLEDKLSQFNTEKLNREEVKLETSKPRERERGRLASMFSFSS